MIVADLFETRVEEKIEPVIKVAEREDERKLAAEIGSYVVTPMIEKYFDDFLEHYTDTFLTKTTEVGIWISGYFGSGKSHLAKIMALLTENRSIEGITACERFESRLPPDGPRTSSILRSLKRMDQCNTSILAFNLNTLSSSRTRELPELLLSQYYLSRGYCNNLTHARVIEAEPTDRERSMTCMLHLNVYPARSGRISATTRRFSESISLPLRVKLPRIYSRQQKMLKTP